MYVPPPQYHFLDSSFRRPQLKYFDWDTNKIPALRILYRHK